ncbi:hypothetical protein C8J56DRAFT_903080 [Mycena floridula]|nr:hypothetical protein C8J56DRAFT_903080 [Mycena floridula]
MDPFRGLIMLPVNQMVPELQKSLYLGEPNGHCSVKVWTELLLDAMGKKNTDKAKQPPKPRFAKTEEENTKIGGLIEGFIAAKEEGNEAEFLRTEGAKCLMQWAMHEGLYPGRERQSLTEEEKAAVEEAEAQELEKLKRCLTRFWRQSKGMSDGAVRGGSIVHKILDALAFNGTRALQKTEIFSREFATEVQKLELKELLKPHHGESKEKAAMRLQISKDFREAGMEALSPSERSCLDIAHTNGIKLAAAQRDRRKAEQKANSVVPLEGDEREGFLTESPAVLADVLMLFGVKANMQLTLFMGTRDNNGKKFVRALHYGRNIDGKSFNEFHPNFAQVSQQFNAFVSTSYHPDVAPTVNLGSSMASEVEGARAMAVDGESLGQEEDPTLNDEMEDEDEVDFVPINGFKDKNPPSGWKPQLPGEFADLHSMSNSEEYEAASTKPTFGAQQKPHFPLTPASFDHSFQHYPNPGRQYQISQQQQGIQGVYPSLPSSQQAPVLSSGALFPSQGQLQALFNSGIGQMQQRVSQQQSFDPNLQQLIPQQQQRQQQSFDPNLQQLIPQQRQQQQQQQHAFDPILQQFDPISQQQQFDLNLQQQQQFDLNLQQQHQQQQFDPNSQQQQFDPNFQQQQAFNQQQVFEQRQLLEQQQWGAIEQQQALEQQRQRVLGKVLEENRLMSQTSRLENAQGPLQWSGQQESPVSPKQTVHSTSSTGLKALPAGPASSQSATPPSENLTKRKHTIVPETSTPQNGPPVTVPEEGRGKRTRKRAPVLDDPQNGAVNVALGGKPKPKEPVQRSSTRGKKNR